MNRLISFLLTALVWLVNIVIIFPILLLRGLFRVVRGKPFLPPLEEEPDAQKLAEDLKLEVRTQGDSATMNANLDKLSPNEQREFKQASLELGDFAMHEGHVKHGYDSETVEDLDRCPRCGKPTRQLYDNFVYSARKEMRVMWAPAGYFCDICPTVIIDQQMLRSGVARRFKYQGVLGLSEAESEEFIPFDTWNGKKSLYIMDEDGSNVELTNIDDAPEGAIAYRSAHAYDLPSKERRDKIRQRKKHEKQTRRKNRRRKT